MGVKGIYERGRPVTGAASVGFDDTNYWVYFGTGRFFATDDKTDPQEQYFFGIKEPLATGSTCTDINMTWDTVTSWDADNHVGYDPTAGTPVIAVPGNSPGSQGVLRVDPIQVRDITSTTNGIPYLYCDDGNGGLDVGSACMPDEAAYTDTYNNTTYYQFSELKRYIAGENCYELSNDTNNGIDGWYRVLDDSRERNLSQATLLGGLVTFTSYQPYESVCLSEGLSYLYAVHYQTGTAYYENVFGTDEYADDDPNDSEQMIIVQDRLPLGQGQASTPNLHVGTSHSNPWKKVMPATRVTMTAVAAVAVMKMMKMMAMMTMIMTPPPLFRLQLVKLWRFLRKTCRFQIIEPVRPPGCVLMRRR